MVRQAELGYRQQFAKAKKGSYAMMNVTLRGKPDAGNPHVAPTRGYGGTGRFDEGEVAPAKPRRGSLPYMTRLISQTLTVLLTLVAVNSAFAMTTVVQWDSANPKSALADGKVNLTFNDAGKISAVSISPVQDDEIIVQGDSFSLADGCALTMRPNDASTASIKFENDITGVGSIAFNMDKSDQPEFTGQGIFKNNSTTLPAIVLSNARLDDLELVSCKMGWSGSGFDIATSCAAYHVTRTEEMLVAQMQVADGEYLKVGKVRFEQRGNDVMLVEYPYFRYVETGYVGNKIGCDFDTKNPKSEEEPWGYVEPSAGTYYLGDFVFRRMAKDVCFIVSGGLAASSLTVGSAAHLIADGESALSDEDAYFVPMSIDGVFEIRNRSALSMTGAVSGNGELFCSSNGTEKAIAAAEKVVEVDIPSETLTSGNNPEPLMVADGFSIEQLEGIKAVCIKQKTSKEEPVADDIGEPDGTKGVYFWENDGETASCQVQAIPDEGGCVKGLKIEFTEANGGVMARSWSFWQNKTSALGTDMTLDGNHQQGGAYKVTKMTLCFKESRRPAGSAIALSGVNSMTSGKLRIVGFTNAATRVTIENSKSLPKSGTDIYADGELILNPNDSGYLATDTKINIHDGGIFHQQKLQSLENQFGNQKNGVKFLIDGGSYDAGSLNPNVWGADGPYLNKMNFTNGGRIYGQRIRLGGTVVEWAFSGVGVAVCDTDLSVRGDVSSSENIQELTFRVDDTTGDETPDFKINSAILNMLSDGSFNKGAIVKEGAGTVLHSGANSFNYQPLVIRDGVWMAGVSSALPSAQTVSLEGGSIGVSEGVCVTSGKILIGEVGGGFIVEDGATFSIPAPVGDEWDSDATVSIDLGVGARMRIGTSACLSPAQLSKIKISRVGLAPGRYHAHQDENGYVEAVRHGFAINIR